jgi:hypothetical protein
MKDNEIIKIVPGLKRSINYAFKNNWFSIRSRDYFTVYVQAAHRLHFCRAGSDPKRGSKSKKVNERIDLKLKKQYKM